MSRKPSEGIGDRVARYRRLAGLTARELAEEAGFGLTRGVIANIESGRKTDITVDQLIAISSVLRVPPVVIALPVETPDAFVRTTDGNSALSASRAAALMDWFMGVDVLSGGERGVNRESGNPATFTSRELIRTLRQYRIDRASLSRSIERGKLDDDVVAEREAELAETERVLRQLGVDLTIYKIDE